ncbi:MAG: FmdB family transcriptional regulator [Flavobacteriaceae bacterium]|nr:FmdB family transcriptional regulator [Flavobacteriaceae bacterium]
MPIYEFECSKCNKRFEKIISISNSDKITCDCSPNAVAKKVVSAPSFRLSGKGWYETDFKTGSKKNLVQSDKSDKSDKSEKKSPKTNSTKEK